MVYGLTDVQVLLIFCIYNKSYNRASEQKAEYFLTTVAAWYLPFLTSALEKNTVN